MRFPKVFWSFFVLPLAAGCASTAAPEAAPECTMGAVSGDGGSVSIASTERKSIADAVLNRLKETPFLEVESSEAAASGTYTIHSWMDATRFRSEISEGGRLIYAMAADGKRAQEYGPVAKFLDGRVRHEAIVEYAEENGRFDWPTLLDPNTGCDLGMFSYTWYDGMGGLFQTGIADVISTADDVHEEVIDGHNCLTFHRAFHVGTDSKNRPTVFDHVLSEDIETHDIVCWTKSKIYGDVDKEVHAHTNHLKISHPTTDRGWSWRLGADNLPIPSKATEK